jgi:hypothetical protein
VEDKSEGAKCGERTKKHDWREKKNKDARREKKQDYWVEKKNSTHRKREEEEKVKKGTHSTVWNIVCWIKFTSKHCLT